ncbi:uncharacterized protein LOC142563956 [Dermacentor variabilis]|uniref:uncharacterized protein LOC142563956 n=1 Tax=Dermacentor variabilis TaxID=34621 RepID=UPI003F5BEB90
MALAMNDPSRPYIYTDSRSAIRAFLSGLISKEAAAIIKQRPPDAVHTIAWFPAHMGSNVHSSKPNPNELVHDQARGLTFRNGPDTLSSRDYVAYTCDGNRFIRFFFQCAAGFVNATSNSPKDLHYICRVVSIYRHCVNGARHATHCNMRMELNNHLAYMQNFILEQYEPMCAVRRAAARLSYQRILGDRECDSDRAQKKYEFCAGDFMRMLQLMEIGTDNERICQIREKYRECLETSSHETNCDFKSHGLSRLHTLTTLLARDYGIVCEASGDTGPGERGDRRLRHQSCRERGFLKAIEKCDRVFEDDAVLLKENVFRMAPVRSSFLLRAKAMICMHVRDYKKCLMDTALIFHCYEATAEIMDFFKQKLNRLGISYCSSAPLTHKPFTLILIMALVPILGTILLSASQ